MDDIIEKVRQYMITNKMVQPQDILFAAVSGGADSVGMLLILMQLQKSFDYELHVIHVEHGIRGEESEADACFAQELAAENHLPMHLCKVDVPSFAKEHKMSEEEAARHLRYQAMQEEMLCYAKERGYKTDRIKLAVAHHMDDSAETLLLQLLRGAGPTGLTGLSGKRVLLPSEICLLRPFLCLRRSDIENYLKQKKQSHQEDATNQMDCYTRNYLRHQIMPLLETMNSKAVEHICQSGEFIRELTEINTVEAKAIYQQVHREKGIVRSQLLTFPREKRILVLREFLLDSGQGMHNINAHHLESMDDLLSKEVHKQINLPHQLIARNTYETMEIVRDTVSKEDNGIINIETASMQQDKVYSYEWGNYRIQCKRFARDFDCKIPQKIYTKWMDYDNIIRGLSIRSRREGDRIATMKDGQTTTLKKYFINEKIPKEMRDELPLICDGDQVVCVAGNRLSEAYKITGETKEIIEVEIQRRKTYE